MRSRGPILLALVLVTTVGCNALGIGGQPPEKVAFAKSDVARASTSPADASAAANSINAFGLDLYRRLAGAPGNLVLSPMSLALALAMARAGARGQTAAQMDQVLHGSGSDAQASAINALDEALAGRSGSFPDSQGKAQNVTLRIANAQFAQNGLKLEPAFLDALAERFGAGVRLLDYEHDPEAARRLINDWVSNETEKRIPELLAQGVLTPATRLTLVNAIYLKAPWVMPFLADGTKPGPFTRLDGTTVDVPMMQQDYHWSYARGSGWQAVELPYVGDALAMTLILPDDLTAFQANLDGETLASIVHTLAPSEVHLTMPRFTTGTMADLNPQLAALGMPAAFDPSQADFSAITTQESLFISHVVHQANITVDEKGSEAAAATAVVMDTTAAPENPVTLTLDRPFLFVLRDVPTGAVMFLGRIEDPSASR